MNLKKKILITLFSVLVIIILFTIWYANDYYRADEYANEVFDANGSYFFDSSNDELGFIIYPGAKVEEKAYAPLAKLINDFGYKVAIAQFPMKLAILDINYADDIIKSYPDVEKWVIVAHSLGGTAGSMYVKNNPDIYGLVFLGSYTNADLKNSPVKTISITGTNDNVINSDNFNKAKEFYNDEHIFYTIEGGNHAYFGNYGEQKGDGTATISPYEQQQLTVQYILDTFEK